MLFTIIFHIITASFLAVAEIAAGLPFLNAIRLKKLERAVSFKFPMALAAFLKAIFKRLLPFGILLLSILPPLILLLGASLSQLANCLAVSNLRMPFHTSLIRARAVAWLTPSMASRSTPPKY